MITRQHFVAVLLLLLSASCKKMDVQPAEPVTSKEALSLVLPNCCTYSSVFTNTLADGEPIELPLFSKYLDAQDNQIKLLYFFRNIAGYYYEPVVYTFYYAEQSFGLINEKTADTLASFYFNKHGKIVRAVADPAFSADYDKRTFNFSYAHGKLQAITNTYLGDSNWPYANITYDSTGNNVSTIEFTGFSTTKKPKMYYYYNYDKTAANQYYADETFGDFWAFYQLIRYLDLFPELRPKNLLFRSFFRYNGYPGSVRKRYSNRVFDKAGNLVQYSVNAEKGSPELWRVNWVCGPTLVK